jgi:ABC-2 type transport system ATP-binding protein
VFLDEPTGGVDPVSRRNFWELITSLVREGTTVLVTTHYLDEAEYCGRVFLMHAGKIIREGSPHELKHNVLSCGMLEIIAPAPVVAMELLAGQPWTDSVSLFGTRLHLCVRQDAVDPAGGKRRVAAENKLVADCFKKAGLARPGISKVVPTLEDVFLSLVTREGKEARRQ